MSVACALFNRNIVEAVLEGVRWQRGALVVEEDGLLLVAGAEDFPIGYGNCALRMDPALPAEDCIGRAEDFFAEQGRGFSLWVREGLDADIESALAARGLKPRVHSPWMFLSDAPPVPELPAGIELRWADSVADIEDATGVLAEAYAPTGLPAEITRSLFAAPERLLHPALRVLLLREQGRVLATAQLLCTHGMGGIYWVGTRPDCGRRGLGALATALLVREAFALGLPRVGLHATPMGQPVYARLGFRVDGGHRWYVL
ncbi:MAG: GNAT family N-acetyltransferase [Aquimonas sp.]|nr:GNAT family N-acetyltransferase [Aquimonas sp.]